MSKQDQEVDTHVASPAPLGEQATGGQAPVIQHSPTPWILRHDDRGLVIWPAGDGWVIARFNPNAGPVGHYEALAKLIVHRVNAHAALVSALQAVAEHVSRGECCPVCGTHPHFSQCALVAALALAGVRP